MKRIVKASAPADTNSSAKPATAGPQSVPLYDAATVPVVGTLTSCTFFALPSFLPALVFDALSALLDAAALALVLLFTSVFRLVPLPAATTPAPLAPVPEPEPEPPSASGVMAPSSAVTVILIENVVKVLPVGTAYAVWTGIGAVGAMLIGIFIYHEPASALRILFLLMIVAGIVGLNLTGQSA